MAFLNVVNQFRPLLCENGLLCAPAFVRRVRFRHAPSIFHLFPTDRAFALFSWVGVGLSALAVTGLSERFGTPVSMAVWALLWALYLSYVSIGLTFCGFGWESLLLESGFLAIFLGAADTEPSVIIIWLMRWVLFRVMFGAGLIKVRGDSCWRDLTCLDPILVALLSITPAERRQSGCWWHRELVGIYLPPLSLKDPAFAEILDALKDRS